MIYQVTNTQRKSWNISWNIKKTVKEKVNMLQRPSSLKQMNFKMECFSSLLVTINTVQRWLQHSVVRLLVYDSIHPSLSLLPEYRSLSSSLLAMNVFILPFLFWMVVRGHGHINFTFFCFEWQFPAVNILILLLLSFHFCFYFHFIIKIFCFVLKIKKNLFPVQWKRK